MAPINQKHTDIVNKVFKGDLGAESKLQNDSILALLIRQDAIVNSMTPEQKGVYDTIMEEYEEFTNMIKLKSIEAYKQKSQILGVQTIFDKIEQKKLQEEQSSEETPAEETV